MVTVPNQRSMVFQVHPKLAYNVCSGYNKLIQSKHKLQQIQEQDESVHQSINRIKKELEVQSQRRKVEIENNKALINSQRGQPIMYGVSIQLFHVQSGQYVVMSTKSAEKDKTCQMLELSDQPSASRVAFQILARYRYRQEGDRVVYKDQILLYNVKNNAYMNFSYDPQMLQQPSLDESVQSEFRPKSPKRRRNPENLFQWYEANVSQNFQKWQIICYQQTNDPQIHEYELHGGDVVRIKHAESGGYITVDDGSQERNGLQEAYVRCYGGTDLEEEQTSNQLFELESTTDSLDEAGKVLSWVDDPESGKQVCRIHLRHYNSGRLLQVTYFKDQSNIGQVVTLADSTGLEQDGANIFGKKILTKGGKLQNFIFNLNSRSMVSDSIRTLSRSSVCNLGNTGTKLFLSTQIGQGDDEEEEEEEEVVETEEQRRQNQFEMESQISLQRKKATQYQLDQISQLFDKEKSEQKQKLDAQTKEDQGAQEIVLTNENQVFRKTKGDLETVSQNMLTLKTKASMNDVFLPMKANMQQLRDVSFIHSAVPRIKLYLNYLRKKLQDNLNLPFFISLMELLKGIIYWVLDIDLDDYQNPFTCDGYVIASRQKILRETRFLDLLIDCLIYPFETKMYVYDDLTQQHPITRICQLVYRILKHTCKNNTLNKNYVAQWIDLFFKQAMVTTEKNTFYAEKTISELLEDNKELLDTQIDISTIKSLIELCLKQPKHKRFLELMSHLCYCNGSAIASNQDSIRLIIFDTPKNKQGMLFKIKSRDGDHRVEIIDNTVENVATVPPIELSITEIYSYFLEKKELRLYEYFQALVDLMASICMDRNYKCIVDLENIFTLDMVIDCTLNPNVELALRARFARLLITLHMDKDPLEKLNIPIMTRVWDNIETDTKLPCNDFIPPKLLKLKPAFEKLIRDTKGQCRVYETDFNLFLFESLKIIETMIALGFYATETELIQIVQPLITLLDGSLDFYEKDEEVKLQQQILESGADDSGYTPLIKTKAQHQIRYKKTIPNEKMMKIKNIIIDICVKIIDIQDNKRLSHFLISFSKFDQKLTPLQSKFLQLKMQEQQGSLNDKLRRQLSSSTMQDTVSVICTQLNDWIKDAFDEKNLDLQNIARQDFVAILLDLNLYENADLVANAFKLLVRYFTQKNKILELATEVQVLQDAEEIVVLEQCSEALRQMKKDGERAEFWLGKESQKYLTEARSFVDRLSALTDLNVYRENRVIDLGNKKKNKKNKKKVGNEEDEKAYQFLNLSEFNQQWDDEDKRVLTDYDVFDEQNQRLLRNLRAYDISMQIIKQKSLKNAENKNAYLKVVEKAYIFLIKFIKDNKENQNIVLQYIKDFMEDTELGVHALELITEIFRDNENLLTYPLVPLIKKIASDIDALDIETTKKATLLSFVPVFMFYKDLCLKDNQFLILNEFTSTSRKNSNYLFTGLNGHEDFRIYMAEMKQQYFEFMNDDRLMAEIDVPPEVSYTITYITLIANAARGKNASCETRAQAVFSVQDVITNMEIADFCYPFKSALMFFLQNVYFDVEKEVTEDFTKAIWRILDILIEDMLKFTEVMQRQKRAAGGGAAGPARGAPGANLTNNQSQEIVEQNNQAEDTFTALNSLKVDTNKQFTFTTAFGKFQVSELMQKYVFEGIFPSIEQFFNLRLAMGEKEQKQVNKLLKLLILAVPYKSKPIHDKNIQSFVRSISAIPALQELGADVFNLQSLGISDEAAGGEKIAKLVQISQAQKLKIFMKMSRSDSKMQNQLAKEFEQLVMSIIFIPKKTNEAFKGANTIQVKDFINSLIQSTEVTSDIPTALRTQSLKIIRKVIESENKNSIKAAIFWESDEFLPYLYQIQDAQNMLINMDLVGLLCRIISKEVKREIKEEAFNVCVASLIGGNYNTQMKFFEYIQEDEENEFCKAVEAQMFECFELIKKNQIKRNVKSQKIINIKLTLQEMLEKDVQEDDDEYIKLQEQEKSLTNEIKDTVYSEDELRDGEEMTLSRSIENIIVILRFLQLLCEDHNLQLQKQLNLQTSSDGRPKSKSCNLIQTMARMLEQMLKMMNSITVRVAIQLIDTIIESVQGPCKENQKTLVAQKILDTSREMLNMLLKSDNLPGLGFIPPEESEPGALQEENIMDVLDEFISKIATLLVSLLEGEQDLEILQKMSVSLAFEDIKDRLLDVFGTFINKLQKYPQDLLNKQEGQTPENTPLSRLSKENKKSKFNCLSDVSVNKINNHLSRDDFEGSISEAFEIYIIFQNLADAIPSFKELRKKESYTQDQWKAYDFIRQNTGMIEISIQGKLQRIYFPIRPVCAHISYKTRKSLMINVDRESQQTKVTSLMEAAPLLIDEMRHNESLQSAVIQITPTLMAQLKDFSNVVGLFISLSQLFFLQRINNARDPYGPDQVKLFILIFGIVQGTSSFILITFYAINKYALITKAGWRNYIKMNKNKLQMPENENRLSVKQMSIEQTHLILMCKGPQAEEFNMEKGKRNFGNNYTKFEATLFDIYFFLQDSLFQYYVLYFGISFLGFYTNELYYSFHLLDVIPRFPTLQNVATAVSMNSEQLLMTFGLTLIVMYIYATVLFFYIMETSYDYTVNVFDDTQVGENHCRSMIECYMYVVYFGFIKGGGIGDWGTQINYQEQPQLYFIKFFVDVSFFLVVKIILYNILFGIIIDTFAQLRELKSFMETDKNNKCYICNLNRTTFDKEAEGGFTRHISKDHNLWLYVYYIVHLYSKDPTSYTGIESQISEKLSIADISWMPRQKALCLENTQDHEEGEEEELKNIKEEIKEKNDVLLEFFERLNKLESKMISAKKKEQAEQDQL